MSATPLHVLILEDQPDDAELMALELRRSGFSFDWQQVETKAAYLAALQKAAEGGPPLDQPEGHREDLTWLTSLQSSPKAQEAHSAPRLRL